MKRWMVCGLLVSLLAAMSLAGPATSVLPESFVVVNTAEISPGEETSLIVPTPLGWLVGIESFKTPSAGRSVDLSLGSGAVVRIAEDGIWIATARHILTGSYTAVYLVNGTQPYLVDRIVRDEKEDAALLHVSSLKGVMAVDLSAAPDDPWAAEVGCVRWPGWTYQSYPAGISRDSFTTTERAGAVLVTPTLSILPGCSGGPVEVYDRDGGRFVVGIATGAVSTGIKYVPAEAITSLLDGIK